MGVTALLSVWVRLLGRSSVWYVSAVFACRVESMAAAMSYCAVMKRRDFITLLCGRGRVAACGAGSRAQARAILPRGRLRRGFESTGTCDLEARYFSFS